MPNATKTIVVLLATHNGLRWLPAQLESILVQSGVHVRLIVSDDQSSDGTWDWLQELSIRDERITVLPRNGKFGSAAKNFYRLIVDADISNCDFVAFSDQDDLWEPDKLIRHVILAKQGQFDGISSNVVAFWENGHSVKIDKSQPQRKYDFLFESPGPGCTFLMTPWLIGKLRELLVEPNSLAREIALHDWLAYAVCRASGRAWHIDDQPTVRYRQHQSNEFGAHHGFRAVVSRFRQISEGWYRNEVIKILKIIVMLSSNREHVHLLMLLNQKKWINQLALLQYINDTRRRFIDRLVIALTIALKIF